MAHEATYWASVAAIASACTAGLSLITSIYSNLQSRRSADAADASLRASLRPNLTIAMTEVLRTNKASYRVWTSVQNVGPGVCMGLILWPAEHLVHSGVGTFLPGPNTPGARYEQTWQVAFENPLPSGDGSSFSIDLPRRQNQERRVSRDWVAECEDVAGNRYQTLFRIFVDDETHLLTVIDHAEMTRKKFERLRSRAQLKYRLRKLMPTRIKR